MDVLHNPAEVVSLATTLLLLLLCSNHALLSIIDNDSEEECNADLEQLMNSADFSTVQADAMSAVTLHSFRLWSSLHYLGDDLGFWVKPRSTTWFSKFLLEQYDDDRWVHMFRMTKASVFTLADLLKPAIVKRNTKYRLAIPLVVRLACTLFKLTHGATLLICSELFAVGRSSVSMVLRDVVYAINIVLRAEISWPRGQKLVETEADFRNLCGLPGVLGAIDGTHIGISKPKFGPTDYFYFKSGGYMLNCQAVVDSQKRFLDLVLGMPGSTNDARVLRRSSLYQKANANTLWDDTLRFNGFSPYLLGDAGYPVLGWLMVPHRQTSHLPVADGLFNRRLRRGHGVVENAFAILKQSFRELLTKSDLHVTFLPDVILCCAILHNMMLSQSIHDVQRFLSVLRTEGLNDDADLHGEPEAAHVDVAADDRPLQQGLAKRRQLGLFLASQ